MTGRLGSSVTLRPAVERDREAIRALVEQDLAGTPYREVLAYFLGPTRDNRDEARAIVAERHDAVVGAAVFGEVAGAVGTGRIHYIGVAAGAGLDEVAAELCEAAVRDMVARGDRLVIAETPDEAGTARGRATLARCDFEIVARVRDYYRDGVDLILFQRLIVQD